MAGKPGPPFPLIICGVCCLCVSSARQGSCFVALGGIPHFLCVVLHWREFELDGSQALFAYPVRKSCSEYSRFLIQSDDSCIPSVLLLSFVSHRIPLYPCRAFHCIPWYPIVYLFAAVSLHSLVDLGILFVFPLCYIPSYP